MAWSDEARAAAAAARKATTSGKEDHEVQSTYADKMTALAYKYPSIQSHLKARDANISAQEYKEDANDDSAANDHLAQAEDHLVCARAFSKKGGVGPEHSHHRAE